MLEQNLMIVIFFSAVFVTWTMFSISARHAPSTDNSNAQDRYEFSCHVMKGKDAHIAPLDNILLFPQPKVTIFDNGSTPTILSLSDNVVFSTSHRMDAILQRFCDRARSYRISTTYISIDIDLNLKQKKGFYDIDVAPPMSITARASSLEAVHPLLSTLTQLISQRPVRSPLPLHISDWPEYSWRGLLVDVSRHFIPLKLLKRCLDAMEVSKLNVLHLHLTDAQSFPLLLRDVHNKINSTDVLPLSKLARMGSYDNTSKIYTPEMLRDLVAFAADRGITIVPEIDMPAHSFCWGKAFPDIVLPYNRSTSKVKQLDMVPFDISNPRLLVILEAILQQVAEIFPSQYIHVGGDEIRTEPWLETPHVKAWLLRQGYGTSAREATKAFESSVFSMVKRLGKTPLVWQGILDSDSMPNETAQAIVQPWKCWGGLALRAAETALKRGHPVVMSSCWYLDYDTDWLTYLSADQGAETLMKLSSARAKEPDTLRLHKSGSDSDMASRNGPGDLLGGEGSMWTERVDHTNVECRMWPRAAAIAARLWGAGSNTSLGIGLQELTRLKGAEVSRIRGRHQRLVEIPHEQTVALHASFVHLREYLVAALNMSAAPFVFHYLADQKPGNHSTTSQYFPEQGPLLAHTALSEDEALSLIKKYEVSRTLTSDQSQQPPVMAGQARMTAQCLSLPQEIQRPVSQHTVLALQLNAADGSSTRMKELSRWLESKAAAGALFVGFCELNGWQDPVSKTDIMTNHPAMTARAAIAGFTYSHIMVNSQRYNLGFMSSVPFQVIEELGPPTFQRGVLHVYISKLSLHVIVAHLHAHDSSQREKEASFLASRVLGPLLSKNLRVVVQGDLNTLSPHDSKQHESLGLLDTLNRKDYAGFVRLGNKFLDPSTHGVNYRPMQTLLHTGLVDACFQSCPCQIGLSQWHANGSDPCSVCMVDRCLQSVPTNFSTEWEDATKRHPGVRVDYILISPAIVKEATNAATHGGYDRGIDARIEKNAVTNGISDHYPMEAKWHVAQEYDLFRKRNR